MSSLMRRKEFESTDPLEYQEIMTEAEIGHLGLIDPNGFPRVVPLNFVLVKNRIYFHGPHQGEKFDILKTNPKVAFSVDIPYSYIPSYWQSKKSACTATFFFKSVHIRGHGSLVRDNQEKAGVLQLLMKKHQPEGKFLPLEASERIYQKELTDVAVFRIDPVEVTVKIKFGQNLIRKTQLKLVERLKERDEGMDSETIVEIRKNLETPSTSNIHETGDGMSRFSQTIS